MKNFIFCLCVFVGVFFVRLPFSACFFFFFAKPVCSPLCVSEEKRNHKTERIFNTRERKEKGEKERGEKKKSFFSFFGTSTLIPHNHLLLIAPSLTPSETSSRYVSIVE